MKLSLVLACFTAASTSVHAEEGGLRQRVLASAGGSISVPTCFSEVSSVQVFGKGVAVQMRDLQVGDRIFTGSSYEKVYAFAHLDKSAKAEFVEIQTENGNNLEVTGSHLIFVDGKTGPVRADTIQIGESLHGAAVTKVSTVERAGLYAPLTTSGMLMVDGVLASNYVSFEEADNHAVFGQNVHAFSHLGISPFRLVCSTVSAPMCNSYNAEGIPVVLDAAKKASEWAMNLPTLLQVVVLSAYLAIATMAWVIEYVLAAPLTFAVVTVGVLAANAMTIRVETKRVKTV